MFLIELKNVEQKMAQAIAGEFKGATCPKGVAVLSITDPEHLFPLVTYLNKININFSVQCKVIKEPRQENY